MISALYLPETDWYRAPDGSIARLPRKLTGGKPTVAVPVGTSAVVVHRVDRVAELERERVGSTWGGR